MIAHARSGEHYARVERERLAGESFLDAQLRISIEDALRSTTTQKEAAELLGCSRSTVIRYAHAANERLTNIAVGRPDLNTDQRGREWTERREAARVRASLKRMAANPLMRLNQAEEAS